MFPNSKRPRIDAQPARDISAPEPVNVEHPQQIAIVIRHLLERRADLLAPRLADESNERIGFVAALRLHTATKSNERALLPPSRPAVMHADVSRRLKNESRKCF